MVTPIFCAKNGVEAKQFLMVSHFEGMNKALEVYFMVLSSYFPNLMLMIMLRYTMVV